MLFTVFLSCYKSYFFGILSKYTLPMSKGKLFKGRQNVTLNVKSLINRKQTFWVNLLILLLDSRLALMTDRIKISVCFRGPRY